jgi:hypothetical protein
MEQGVASRHVVCGLRVGASGCRGRGQRAASGARVGFGCWSVAHWASRKEGARSGGVVRRREERGERKPGERKRKGKRERRRRLGAKGGGLGLGKGAGGGRLMGLMGQGLVRLVFFLFSYFLFLNSKSYFKQL